MRPIRLHRNLLGRPARRRRRRRWAAACVVLVMIAGAVVWFVRRPPSAVSATSEPISDTLVAIEPPRIVIPPSLDKYLAPQDDEAEKKGEAIPKEVHGRVQTGQTLFYALREKGVPAHSIQPVVNSVGKLFDFRHSKVGDRFEAHLDDEGTILRFRYQAAPEVVYEAHLVGPGEYQSVRVDVPLDVQTRAVRATIKNSLYAAVKSLGESESLARKMTHVLRWDIDFSRDVRPGDAFRMLYERVNLDGRFLRYGRILALEYRGARTSVRTYWFEAQGGGGYYSADGRAMKGQFLAAPCAYRRISSQFDLHRMHPILHRIVPHLGVDYAADVGTPVRAVADGRVMFAGKKKASGTMVALRHKGHFRTAYAHMRSIAPGIKRGQQVNQGEVIGYVGNSGRSTGPHLHFSMKKNGQFVDPLKYVGQRGPQLKGRELQEFYRVRDRFQLRLGELPLPVVGAPPVSKGTTAHVAQGEDR